jgi:hypothetical protein
MTATPAYSREQLARLISAHKLICAQRSVDPNSEDGRDLAARLLNECSGSEEQAYMIRRFAQ